MAREYVPIFFEWLDVTQDLTAEEKGNLIDALVLFYRFHDHVDNDLYEWNVDDKTLDVMEDVVRKISSFRNLQNGRPTGEFHWNWKGGKTPVNQRERSSGRYAEWRNSVFSRDGFTCQLCGQVGGSLQAHHIKRWSTNVDERYQVSNGVTLCVKCHKAIHKKGG
jgi:predicted restriction endonuclease